MQAQEAHYYINFLLKGFSHVLVTFRVDKDSNPMCGLVRNNFKKVWLKQQQFTAKHYFMIWDSRRHSLLQAVIAISLALFENCTYFRALFTFGSIFSVFGGKECQFSGQWPL